MDWICTALGLIDALKSHNVPTAPELFWMIPHDADLPQEFLPLPEGVSIDPSEDYISNDDGHKVIHSHLCPTLRFNLFTYRFYVAETVNGHHHVNN